MSAMPMKGVFTSLEDQPEYDLEEHVARADEVEGAAVIVGEKQPDAGEESGAGDGERGLCPDRSDVEMNDTGGGGEPDSRQ